MNTSTVDEVGRIRLPNALPGEHYAIEALGDSEILLRRVTPTRKRTKEEVMATVRNSSLRFEATWDEMKDLLR